ncbi:MAG: glycosyltransferase family 4 protein [Hyphomicrobiaceae bacterium]
MRILHCLRAPIGGLFRHVCDLASEQARLGHAVGIVCDDGSVNALSERRLTELEPHLELGLTRLAMSRHISLSDLTAYRGTLRLVRSADVEVLHGHGAKGGAYARLAARALKRDGRRVAAIYTPHGGSLHYDPSSLIGRIYLGLEQQLARLTDAVIFESAFAAETFRQKVGRLPGQVAIIPNGLTAADFMPHRPAADAADLLFVGELRQLKGVDVLLEAMARIAAERPVGAVIVGSGPDAASFKELAERLGLSGRVSFPGAMPVHDAFALGRCLVVPSRAESLPYVVLEAVAAGVPLVATRVGGIPEIVDADVAGLVPPGDPEALAVRLRAVLNAPAAARETADRLKLALGSRFTVSAMAASALSVYAACLEARPVVRHQEVPTAS